MLLAGHCTRSVSIHATFRELVLLRYSCHYFLLLTFTTPFFILVQLLVPEFNIKKFSVAWWLVRNFRIPCSNPIAVSVSKIMYVVKLVTQCHSNRFAEDGNMAVPSKGNI